MIYICTYNDTETVIFCITTDENKALKAVKNQIKTIALYDENENEDDVKDIVDQYEYVISCVEDGKQFWWKEGDGDIGKEHLAGMKLANRLN